MLAPAKVSPSLVMLTSVMVATPLPRLAGRVNVAEATLRPLLLIARFVNCNVAPARVRLSWLTVPLMAPVESMAKESATFWLLPGRLRASVPPAVNL